MNSGISVNEALELLQCEGAEVGELIGRANAMRRLRRGDEVDPCAIVNAKSGNCGQNCSFCAQSSRSRAAIDKYPLLSAEELFRAGRKAARIGANRFSIVTSGRSISDGIELETIATAISRTTQELPLTPCASLGLLDRERLRRLQEAGMTRYHHNLETCESHFANICTSRQWRDSLTTIEAARSLGLELCVGGIIGLGESLHQRVELLESIRQLDVQSAPLNFLHPIPGTPLESLKQLKPLDCIKVVAVARLMMPDREIRVCGGREHNLRDLQSWLLLAGADGLMVGGYLTTSGRTVADDIQMIEDAGLRIRPRTGT